LYKERPGRPSTQYAIYNRADQTYNVFCDVKDGYGYTYISTTTRVPINIRDLYNDDSHALVRQLTKDGHQLESKFQQISSFRNRYPLSFFYNSHPGFATPMNVNMTPYLYMGFLPSTEATHRHTQGYRANGVDYTFTNCDGNPNSYLAFMFDQMHLPPVGYFRQQGDAQFNHYWSIHATAVPMRTAMPADYFSFFEMHMGGCGGYTILPEYTNLQGAALGLRFGNRHFVFTFCGCVFYLGLMYVDFLVCCGWCLFVFVLLFL
jgi:hypothetical protein